MSRTLNGIEYEYEYVNDFTFQLITPSFRAYVSRAIFDHVQWFVVERDTGRQLGQGSAKRPSEAVDQITRTIANA